MGYRWIFAALLTCAGFAGLGVGAPAEKDADTLTAVGDAVPAFAIQTVDGRTLTPEALAGKVVLINFFATWCGPCVMEMPHLQKEVWEKYKDDERFALVAVGREHTDEEVASFAKEHGLTFAVAADPKRATYGLFAEKYIPRNYVIGPDGTILFQSVGYNDSVLKEIDAVISKALKESADDKEQAS